MIRVVRIAGEAFDIETGAKSSKALVLSNGVNEVHVPVRDDIINAVLHLVYHAPENTKEGDPMPPPPEVIVQPPPEDRSQSAYDDPRSGTASI
jgi:hypothetical protein